MKVFDIYSISRLYNLPLLEAMRCGSSEPPIIIKLKNAANDPTASQLETFIGAGIKVSLDPSALPSVMSGSVVASINSDTQSWTSSPSIVLSGGGGDLTFEISTTPSE